MRGSLDVFEQRERALGWKASQARRVIQSIDRIPRDNPWTRKTRGMLPLSYIACLYLSLEGRNGTGGLVDAT